MERNSIHSRSTRPPKSNHKLWKKTFPYYSFPDKLPEEKEEGKY